MPVSSPPPAAPLGLLQATTFVSTIDRFVMPPMLVAIAAGLGVPLSEVLQAAGAYFLAYGLMQPVWGVVSDRLGRVRTLRLTLLLAGVASVASAFSPSVLLLGLTRAVAGGFFGAAYPATLIYVGDTVPAAVRQPAIARLMVGVALGTALASAGAGTLADVTSWRVGFVVTGSAAVLMAALLGRLPEPERRERPARLTVTVGTIARSRVAVFVLLMAFLEGVVLLGGLTLLPAAAEAAGSTTTVAGVVTGVYGISVYLGARLVGVASLRWHPARLIATGAFLLLVALLLLTVSRSAAAAATSALLLGLAWVSMHSSLQTWATEVIPSARATVVSLFAGSLFAGSAAAAALAGAPAEAGRYAVVFAVGSCLAIPLGVAAAWGRWRWRPGGPSVG